MQGTFKIDWNLSGQINVGRKSAKQIQEPIRGTGESFLNNHLKTFLRHPCIARAPTLGAQVVICLPLEEFVQDRTFTLINGLIVHPF